MVWLVFELMLGLNWDTLQIKESKFVFVDVSRGKSSENIASESHIEGQLLLAISSVCKQEFYLFDIQGWAFHKYKSGCHSPKVLRFRVKIFQ